VIRTPMLEPQRSSGAQTLSEVRINVPPLENATLTVVGPHQSRWDHFANAVSNAVGTPLCFYVATGIVAVWLAIGQPFHWDNTWQLVMNSISSVATFLMVFILQSSQNRDTRNMQLQMADLRNNQNRDTRNMQLQIADLSNIIRRLEDKLDAAAPRAHASSPGCAVGASGTVCTGAEARP
jgi:low affinity Fe/Cu permease